MAGNFGRHEAERVRSELLQDPSQTLLVKCTAPSRKTGARLTQAGEFVQQLAGTRTRALALRLPRNSSFLAPPCARPATWMLTDQQH